MRFIGEILVFILLCIGGIYVLRMMVPRYTDISVPVESFATFRSRHSNTIEGKVVKVKDGDSVVLLKGEEDFAVIRMQHIDAPENGQAYSEEAWKHLSKLCRQKQVIVLVSDEEDRYNRVIGEVLLADGTNVNLEMVRAGYAWHFEKYSDRADYAELQQVAKQRRKGLWAESNPMPPHVWRKQKEAKPAL